jgi:hypothetical protein
MIVTKEQLKALYPCIDGYEYWLKVNKPDLEEFMIQAWEDGYVNWANWLFVRVVPRELYLKYAIYSAELSLPIFEKCFPYDRKPRNAIKIAKKEGLEGNIHPVYYNCDEYSSCSAAQSSARSAYAAAYAAHPPMSDYEACARASNFSVISALNAFLFSFDCVDNKKVEKKIIDYGIKILREFEDGIDV